MYSVVAFLVTLVELLIVVGSYALQSTNLFYVWLLYGSPFYLAMNLFNADSALIDTNPIYLMMLSFHIFKYFIIFRAQIVDHHNPWRYGAILFEAAYLCLSGYYLN